MFLQNKQLSDGEVIIRAVLNKITDNRNIISVCKKVLPAKK